MLWKKNVINSERGLKNRVWCWMEKCESWGGEAHFRGKTHTHTNTHTSSLNMSSHLSISSVELQQTVSDVASFVCVCVCVCVAPSSWVTFVGQGVAGQITDYCELFVCSLHLLPPCWIHFIHCWHTAAQFVQVKFNPCRWPNNEQHHYPTLAHFSWS